MVFQETEIRGCWQIAYDKRGDNRGFFVKTCHQDFFQPRGLSIEFREQYYSSSQAGVVRGMHFQSPPHDHDKLITCLTGSLFDVILDLRRGSPSFKKSIALRLDSSNPSGIYIPRGCAHGFCALENNTLMLYNVTSVYQPASDAGVLWHSIGVDWPVSREQAIVSPRDEGFPSLESFDSPFRF